MKYLGVRLDQRLNFKYHVTDTLKKELVTSSEIVSHALESRQMALRTKVAVYLLWHVIIVVTRLVVALNTGWNNFNPVTSVHCRGHLRLSDMIQFEGGS